MPRKRHHEDEMEDEDMDGRAPEEEEDGDEFEDDDEDTIDLDSAEDEEEDEDDVDDDEEDEDDDSAESVERKKIFQAQAEEVMENLTLEDVKEVLKENDQDPALASKLKKVLHEVVEEGDVESMDEAWEEALDRLDE